MKATAIRQWAIVDGRLEGVVPNWVGQEGRCQMRIGDKTIRTSKIKRQAGTFVETIGGGYYQLVGLSRQQLIEAAQHDSKAH